MAEFQGIFCRPFLPSVLIIEGVGGWDGRRGGVGRDGEGWVGREVAKTTPRDTPWASMTPTQWPITLQWATQPVGADTGPHCPIGALHGSHCSSRDSGGSAKCPRPVSI